jgi:hypothetical protein
MYIYIYIYVPAAALDGSSSACAGQSVDNLWMYVYHDSVLAAVCLFISITYVHTYLPAVW